MAHNNRNILRGGVNCGLVMEGVKEELKIPDMERKLTVTEMWAFCPNRPGNERGTQGT